MSSPTSAASGTPSGAPTANKSKVIKLIVFIFFILVILGAITILNNNRKSKINNEKEVTEKNDGNKKPVENKVKEYGKEYNLEDISYGDSLQLSLNPGEIIKVNLTNDWCPMWSSDPVKTKDSEGVLRTLDKGFFITGPKASFDNSYFIINNIETNSVTVKFGRCRSKDNCTIKF